MIYFNVKELYEQYEEKGAIEMDDPDEECETFGWSLTDSWHEIGSVYIFLISWFNLIDVRDESPIFDTKGIMNGKQEYSVQLSVLDYDRSTPLNIYEYETVRDLLGKHLKVTLGLKRAKDIPERYTYRTKASYDWINSDRTYCETQVMERKREPNFAYEFEHIELITEDFVETLMYHTLTIKVWGMMESKTKNKKIKAENAEEVSDSEDFGPAAEDGGSTARKSITRRVSKADGKTGKGGDKDIEELAR